MGFLKKSSSSKLHKSAIFLSPIFKTEKNKKFLGIQKFNYITLRNNIKILGLGGIKTDNIRQLKLFKIERDLGYGKKTPTFRLLKMLIKTRNNGVLDTRYQVPWELYKNMILITNKDGLQRIPTRILKIINL